MTMLRTSAQARTPEDRADHSRRARLRRVGAVGAAQLAMRVVGRLLARRIDSGDESSTSIRRVRTFDRVRLAPSSPSLTRVRLDLVFAGAQLDLTGATPRPGGIDLTVTGAFGGGDVRVPRDWRVTWDKRGIGGVGGSAQVSRDGEDADADLRIHLRTLMGGLGVRNP